MAITKPSSTEADIRRRLQDERHLLVVSLDELRGELKASTDVRAIIDRRVRPILPLAVGGALATGFVLSGGIGASVRYALRRSRDGEVRRQLKKKG